MNQEEQIVPLERVPFAQLEAAFERAREAARDAAKVVDVGIADYRVRLNVVGKALTATIRRAFSHLIVPTSGSADLSINVWDQAETGVCVDVDYYAGHRSRDVAIILKLSADGRYICEQRDTSVSWLDTASSRIFSCTKSTSCQYLDERARPFHKLISAWLSERGIQFAHAGLIDAGGTGVLFVGNGGAGKSTSSVACLRAGMGYLGDDFVGIEETGERYTGHGLFSSCLLNVDHLRRFPDLRPHALPAHRDFEEKSILFLDDVFPRALRKSVLIGALLLPRVVERRETSYRRATKAEALFAMAPTSVMFLPRPSQQAFERVALMVERIPAYWLELGSNIDRIPEAVRMLVHELNGPAKAAAGLR